MADAGRRATTPAVEPAKRARVGLRIRADEEGLKKAVGQDLHGREPRRAQERGEPGERDRIVPCSKHASLGLDRIVADPSFQRVDGSIERGAPRTLSSPASQKAGAASRARAVLQ